MSRGFDDSRWLTFLQAKERGWNVRKGARGTPVFYYQSHRKEIKKDADGKTVLNARGEPILEQHKLARPILKSSTVFNAAQVDGVPPYEPLPLTWDPHQRVENMIYTSGAKVMHNQADAAFYDVAKDTIYMPARSQFPSADDYYCILLHQLSHFTGHPLRMKRKGLTADDKKEEVREELRAEIAAMMLGTKLGVGHRPQSSAAFVEHWAEILTETPAAIYPATTDAARIVEHVMTYDVAFHQQSVAPSHARLTALKKQLGQETFQPPPSLAESVSFALKSSATEAAVLPTGSVHDGKGISR
ncbi:MAG: ssDNA-binding domain-containing protein [Verrucomicrobiales bacterium]|nr:ssDNA-binding domain-containing protein [Verrucomicrobiales bacterium]